MRAYDGLHAALVPEVYYGAPLLGHLCRDLGGDCTFVVATDGGSGSCGLPGGCLPDLGTLREQEMRDAAAIYGATLDLWRLSNGEFPGDTGTTRARWSADRGSEQALVDALVGVLDTVDPDLVLATDPVHGGSCHAEHRVVGQLLLRALERTSATPETYFAQGYGMPPRFSDARLLAFDASIGSDYTGADAWDFIRLNALTHPSQISMDGAEIFGGVSPRRRRVYFLRAEDVTLDDPEYLVCPNG